MSIKYLCPVCGSNVIAWADIDAQISFKVSEKGNLTKQSIENLQQTDGRCGVHCSDCEWDMDDISDETEPFYSLANEALKRQALINFFSVKRG